MKKIISDFGREGLITFGLSLLGLGYILFNYAVNIPVGLLVVIMFVVVWAAQWAIFFYEKDVAEDLFYLFLLTCLVCLIFATILSHVAGIVDSSLILNKDSFKLTEKGSIFFLANFLLYICVTIFSFVSVKVYQSDFYDNIESKKEQNDKEREIKTFCSLIGINTDTYDVLISLSRDKTEDLKSKVFSHGNRYPLEEGDSVLLLTLADGFWRLSQNAYNYNESINEIRTTYVNLVNDYIERVNNEVRDEKRFSDKKNQEILEEIDLVKRKYKKED